MAHGKQNNSVFYKAYVTINMYGLGKAKQPNSVFYKAFVTVNMHGLGKAKQPIILPAKSRSDVMFCLQSYGT